MIYFILLFVCVIPEPWLDAKFLLSSFASLLILYSVAFPASFRANFGANFGANDITF